MRLYLEGIGLCGPGFSSWEESRAMIAEIAPYQPAPTIIPAPALLAPTERRRTVPPVRLAMAVGTAALDHAGRDPQDMATVFTSSGADGETLHTILEVLATETREVSPTRFHNSVHNAPSGYWTIAVGSHAPTTSLCAYDASFSAGLLAAAAQCVVDRRAITLIAYDLPYTGPLSALRPIISSFGVGLVLTPEKTDIAFAALDVGVATIPISSMNDAALETLRSGNPAARCLPFLKALAQEKSQTITIEYLQGRSVSIAVDIL